MKQYIQAEIVNRELDDKQRSKLKNSLEDLSGWDGSFITKPGLSIGQMVEFLWNNNYQPEDFELLTFDDSTPDLCNDLWETTKEILNGK